MNPRKVTLVAVALLFVSLVAIFSRNSSKRNSPRESKPSSIKEMIARGELRNPRSYYANILNLGAAKEAEKQGVPNYVEYSEISEGMNPSLVDLDVQCSIPTACDDLYDDWSHHVGDPDSVYGQARDAGFSAVNFRVGSESGMYLHYIDLNSNSKPKPVHRHDWSHRSQVVGELQTVFDTSSVTGRVKVEDEQNSAAIIVTCPIVYESSPEFKSVIDPADHACESAFVMLSNSSHWQDEARRAGFMSIIFSSPTEQRSIRLQ